MIYEIQHRIETLAQSVGPVDDLGAPFLSMDIQFSHWDFNFSEGWKGHYWLAKGTVDAPNCNDGYEKFHGKMAKIVPRIALLSQCYTDWLVQPFLILRSDAEIALFRFTRDRGATGLMFTGELQQALTSLLENSQIPEEFFYYWNDAVNSTGYSSKLVLMFSAIEALVKKPDGGKDFAKLESILGSELKTALWGTKGSSSGGLRHRLIHGEYFNPDDSGKDYLNLVHKKIIAYFNNAILGKKLINENVVSPQRHPFGNKEESTFFIRARGSKTTNLKDVLADAQKKDFYQMENYEIVHDKALTENY